MSAKLLTLVALTLLAQGASAGSKLLATSGATTFEGAAGGGIVPWSLIGGYGDAGEWGGGIAATHIAVKDFRLNLVAAHVGFDNRLELSLARQTLDVRPLDLSITQDVYGAKVRLFGDLIYPGLPQTALGIQHKRNRDSAVPLLLGAEGDEGTDVYIAASKLLIDGLLGRNLLVNGTLRHSDANQTGLLGFGGGNGGDLLLEASVGLFVTRHWVIGTEYRQKPDNLAAVREDDWRDVFVGWFPNKHLAVVLAWSDLGDIAGLPNQSGWYLSTQLNW